MFRNREFKRFSFLFLIIAAVSVTFSFVFNTAAGIISIISAAAFGTAFLSLPNRDMRVLRRFQTKLTLCFTMPTKSISANLRRENFQYCRVR